jgi:hypothetical protein
MSLISESIKNEIDMFIGQIENDVSQDLANELRAMGDSALAIADKIPPDNIEALRKHMVAQAYNITAIHGMYAARQINILLVRILITAVQTAIQTVT